MLGSAFYHAHANFPIGGTCLEFGVWTGGTYLYQVDQILTKFPGSKLIGFDSWQGLPEETEGVWRPDRHSAGRYSSPKQTVLDGLSSRGVMNDPRFRLVDGFFSDSLTAELREGISDLILVNVDVDLHRSTMDILNWIFPLIRPGVTIYFDDWKDPTDQYDGKWGEHLAWEQWITMHPDIKYRVISVNEYNQRYLEIL